MKDIFRQTEGLLTFHPEVVILPTEEVDRYAADVVLSQISAKPNSVLTLPTGSTPIGMYGELVRAYQMGRADFGGVRVFNLDEYWKIRPDHPASYAHFMRQHLVDLVNLSVSNWNIPDGMAEDPALEALRYEQLIKAKGPVDLAVLGIGPGRTCHIGFNEKGSLVTSRTRRVNLDPETVAANVVNFSNPEEMPEGAITQGIATILGANRIMLLAKGEGKAWGIWRTLTGPINPDSPASFLRYHPRVTFVLDDAAASQISVFEKRFT